MTYSEQKPDETVAYSQRITGIDSIASAAWAMTPAGGTTSDEAFDDKQATILVAGLTAGVKYTLTCTLGLASGQIRVGDITIACKR